MKALWGLFFCAFSNLFVKKVVQDLTSGGIDWQREKWQSGLGSKFIHQGEKNAVKYADEVIVLSKGVQDYFKETYGRETHFIPNGVNRPQIREAGLITDKFGLKKDSYILFLGRLVPEKGIRYLVEAFKNVKTDKKLVIAGGSSDTDSFMEELKDLAKGDDRILFTGFVQGAMLDELYSNTYILEKDKTLSFYRECFQQVVGIRSSTMDWGLDANPEEGRLNEEQEIEQISTYLNFYRTNVCFLPKVIPEDIVYDEEYLKKICGAQLFPNLADARDSKEKLFRIANALSLPIGGIEQLLITQFIIKKGEDYQKISELLHMIAEQH
ncbi:glycosyltransferase family 4 protein [Faecalibacterium prausnitzii]